MEPSAALALEDVPLNPVWAAMFLAADDLGRGDPKDSSSLCRLFAPADRCGLADAWIDEAKEWLARAARLSLGDDGTMTRCSVWRETLHAMHPWRPYDAMTAVK